MAGIYIHIPFCKKKCSYCDFYSIGFRNEFDSYKELIKKEIDYRKSFLNNEEIETIYFGGGTPSLIPESDISTIVQHIKSTFNVSENPEITLEANPDDLTSEKLETFLKTGINRLSIGIQSFSNQELKLLGRRHDAESAKKSIRLAQKVGFKNISIDLIYGLPESTLKSWENTLNESFAVNVQHLSCYHLTYEEGTPFHRKLIKGTIKEIDEELSEQQFLMMRDMTSKNGFLHYEVSNFAKDGFISKHNTSYWKGYSYLGLGPSAHSYDGQVRQWNTRSYDEWARNIESGNIKLEGETLDTIKKFNEILLTRLRTIWGIDLIKLKCQFGSKMVDSLIHNSERYISQGKMILKDDKLSIHPNHFFISDGIITDLLVV